MKKRIAILFVAIFAVGLVMSACQPKSQCKRYKKKQKKRVRMSENKIQHNDIVVQFVKDISA
jgi:predicted membrane protein